MGYSKAQKAQSREHILEVTSRQIKASGIQSVAIAEVMKEAGLTQGAFYGHFESRDHLLVEAVRRARHSGFQVLLAIEGKNGHPSLKQILEVYLGLWHVKNAGAGCAIAALVGDARTASSEVKAEITVSYRELVDFIAKSLSGRHTRGRAVGILSAMVGAVATARAVSDPKLVRPILEETTKSILINERNQSSMN